MACNARTRLKPSAAMMMTVVMIDFDACMQMEAEDTNCDDTSERGALMIVAKCKKTLDGILASVSNMTPLPRCSNLAFDLVFVARIVRGRILASVRLAVR
ncbi:uncharacterized protein PITG_08486 [Phytophthora infestans T30-4]|uniref:Uncharacterized protein n=1 Tax=Phytophthora infestans (strain T30-4) TaxID=403677 RepID=D0NAQ8_PHYIT|nr:uncharacterized protein PITG_08486 [Phytophthora infestans T30-4]EEY54916.1 hypothetical protein PITG_08486 [Phytophthora infestans T30-4]|eukprot:XP_002903861.1 hypothetical protein PITG_08486 [Phytophthora infestans T30-4]